MNNKDLENKSEIEDLELVVDENLRFWNHFIDKVNKAIVSFNFKFNYFCTLICFLGTS